MVLKDINALLITCPTNIRYLTGFVGVAPEEREAYALLTRKQLFLFTNALYLESAIHVKGKLVEISREEPFAKKLSDSRSRGAQPTYSPIVAFGKHTSQPYIEKVAMAYASKI